MFVLFKPEYFLFLILLALAPLLQSVGCDQAHNYENYPNDKRSIGNNVHKTAAGSRIAELAMDLLKYFRWQIFRSFYNGTVEAGAAEIW